MANNGIYTQTVIFKCIYSHNKHLLNSFSMADTRLDPGDIPSILEIIYFLWKFPES